MDDPRVVPSRGNWALWWGQTQDALHGKESWGVQSDRQQAGLVTNRIGRSSGSGPFKALEFSMQGFRPLRQGTGQTSGRSLVPPGHGDIYL